MAQILIPDEPEQDPTTGDLTAIPTAKPSKAEMKKYLLLIPPETYADLDALVMLRNIERKRAGGKAYSLNQLIIGLLSDYLDEPEIKKELSKARQLMGA